METHRNAMTQKKVFFYWGWPDALEQQFREPTADFISGDYIR